MSTQMLNEHTFATAAPAMPSGRAAAAAVPDTMTVTGVASKAFIFLVVTFIFGAIGWNRALEILGTGSGIWFLIGYLVLIGLCLAAVNNPAIAMATGFLYAILMGLWMGAISRVYEAQYDGIVGQALLATVGAFLACLILYTTGVVKPSSKLIKVIVGATFGIFILYLVAFVVSLFGGELQIINDPSPLGIALSIGICLVAASNFFIDFAVIDGGIERGAPASSEWYAAFGILSTLVWLYVELLRLISLVRQ